MLFVFVFILELIILYLLSRKIINLFAQLFFKLTRSKKITVYLLAFLFLPGTLLHELSHWIMAKILFVSTGKISLWPQATAGNIKFGSITMQKPDVVRRLLIGTAPIYVGVGIMLVIFYFSSKYNLFNSSIWTILLGLLVFEIGNTMYSSKKDMEGSLGFIIISVIIGIIFYLINFQLPVLLIKSIFAQNEIITIFQEGSKYLLVPIIINSILIIISKILIR